MSVRSVRFHVFLGALLWTLGLIAALNLLLTGFVRFNFLIPGLHVVATPHRAPSGLLAAHSTAIFLTSVLFMVWGLDQLRRGLRPLGRLRKDLSGVREGVQQRVQGEYPAEIEPLVDDLNALLEHRERTVSRALAKAGDLAHGLKTPLAILSQQADRAAEAGDSQLAEGIAQQVERMRRQIEYHLAHARAAASGAAPGVRAGIAACADALARTMRQLHVERSIALDVHVSNAHVVHVQREDLDEMLGNLLDNACKWARARVNVESIERDSAIEILVDDDGPGIQPEMREHVLQRGSRADEGAPGFGLGLAIVSDLAELYGGAISLSTSPLGGLRAALRLPS